MKRLLAQLGAFNSLGRVPDAWAGALGRASVGANLAGWLTDGLDC